MDYINFVNIKQGSKSNNRFSNGNTVPLIQRPFGFASFAPQTNDNPHWFYHPEDRCLEGVRLTHHPCPWLGDHGAMVMLPQNGEPKKGSFARRSAFDFKNAVLLPHYLKYYLYKYQTTIELTPTQYGAAVKVEYDRLDENFFSVLPVGGNCSYLFDKETNRLYCSTDYILVKGHDTDSFRAYFVYQFNDGDIDPDKTLVEDSSGKMSGLQIEGENTAIHLAVNNKTINFTLAESYISYSQALTNLQNDAVFSDFYALKKENEKIWNEKLGRITVEDDENVLKTFYSCMYRIFLYPHRAYEIDENGEAVHYAPTLGKAVKGKRYTDNGFWDTYRTVYPLFSLIAKDECLEILEGFIQDYKDGGWLPCWTTLDAKKCMPSTMIDAVIADCAVKGILKGELLETALEGMEKHANIPSTVMAYGRDGCEDYIKLGYVPCDKHRESVNLTLDAAYCDYCIGMVCSILGNTEKAQKYFERSKNYRNLFDKETGFMRPKNSDGNFREEFDQFSWGRDYTEAGPWQTTFAVQHDFTGLANLYGGREKLIEKLDELFATPPAYRADGYGFEIHEMTEFMAGDWGQCAICNQPSFHLPFIYAYLEAVEKTEYWVHRICREAFSWEDDGFPGDEDNGTMAAWYIFACLGMYPLTPGRNEYVKFKGFAKFAKIKETIC